MRVNSQGLRDRERSIEKPVGTYRIALLGDSFTAGEGVRMEETYGAILEQALHACPALADLRPEVVNFAVTAYGTTQELLTFRHHARAYNPDLVMVGIFTGNDISNNVRSLYGLATALRSRCTPIPSCAVGSSGSSESRTRSFPTTGW